MSSCTILATKESSITLILCDTCTPSLADHDCRFFRTYWLFIYTAVGRASSSVSVNKILSKLNIPNVILNVLAHEIMALFVLRKFILQTCMRSHPVGLDVWLLVRPFVFFYTSCVRTGKALARLRECAGSPEPSLVAYVNLIPTARHHCFVLTKALFP